MDQLTKFDLAYNAQQGTCNPRNQSKLTSIYSEIESKISTIKDPEPDIEKIKSDLIGGKNARMGFLTYFLNLTKLMFQILLMVQAELNIQLTCI